MIDRSNCLKVFMMEWIKEETMNLEERITNAVMEKLTDGTVEELVKRM